MEILRAEHLTKIYGKGNTSVTAVNDLSLSVAQGEFVAVVGSSGSGKSTLLHMLGGVDQPTEGKVWIQGEDIYTLSTGKLPVFPAQADRSDLSVFQPDPDIKCGGKHYTAV